MDIITALLSLQLAVAPTIAPFYSAPGAVEESSQMTLVVLQNNRGVPVTVYAEDEWGDVKLGVVDADATTTLRLPRHMVERGDIRLFIVPRGQAEESTGPLDLSPGDQIDVIVPKR